MRQMANGASAPGTCGFEPFVHGLQVAAQRVRPWPCVRSGRLAILANVGFPESVLEMGEVEAAARKLFHLRCARAERAWSAPPFARTHRPVPDRREHAFDGIRRPQMVPMLGREVVERKQDLLGLTWAGLAPADCASFLGAFLQSGYALPPLAYPRRHSHPDCRSPLTLIAARHRRLTVTSAIAQAPIALRAGRLARGRMCDRTRIGDHG
jgi:hypothetical protein